jgi:hypothetical protein
MKDALVTCVEPLLLIVTTLETVLYGKLLAR